MKQKAIKVYGDSWDRGVRGESFRKLSDLLNEGWTVNRVDTLGDRLIYILDYNETDNTGN